MQLINQWSGKNTPEDSIGTSPLVWEGTEDYLSGAFKLSASDKASTNKLIFKDFTIEAGIPFAFSGIMLASNNKCFPHISTGYTKDDYGLGLVFDFSEGLFTLFINGKNNGHKHFYFAARPADLNWEFPTTFNNWHTWTVSYKGGTDWGLVINDYDVPLFETVGDFNTFNGTINADSLKMYNDGEFGEDSYVLMKDLQFHK